MGVAGSGKTSVGIRLSEILGWQFFDGDDFHTQDSITKMSNGIPLNDQDRKSWLENLHELIRQQLDNRNSLLLACSALKRKYRDQIREGNPEVVFVYLKGNADLILSRMRDRQNHYMQSGMLRSQFEDLEEPREAIVINIDQDLDLIVEQILMKLDLER